MPSSEENTSDLFNLPPPVVDIIRKTEEAFSSEFVQKYKSIILKLLEWSFFYFLSFLGFGFGWVLFFVSIYYFSFKNYHEAIKKTLTFDPKTVPATSSALPSWVSYPDFDRVEWINEILSQVWRNIDSCATLYVKTLIEPELHKILELMQLNQVSGFRIKRVDLGKIPARLEGMKTYDKKFLGAKMEEIVLDCDVVYAGDARVIFTLQGISAEIKDIKFRGVARIHLKPLLNGFPFVGGFEMYFLTMPTLEYGLGGVGTFGEVPGINNIVRSVVEDVIKSRFVWPSKFKLFLPLDIVNRQSKTSYMLPCPAGLLSLNIREAKDLVKKDKNLIGSGSSDPYVNVSIGERKISFRNQYVAKSVNPTWDYITNFVMEDPSGQKIDIDVFDFDTGSADDSLGTASIQLSEVTQQNFYDKWIPLNDVKKGDIHVQCEWNAAIPANEHTKDQHDLYVISIFVDRCENLAGGKSNTSSMQPKCKLKLEGGSSTEKFSTLPKNETESPVFEEGFLMTSKEPSKEKLIVEVKDTKGIDTVLGFVKIPIDYLMTIPQKEEIDKEWTLEGGNPDARLHMSVKLYCLQ